MNPRVSAALQWSKYGQGVVFLKPQSKEPDGRFSPRGAWSATTNRREIQQYFAHVPDGNLGVAMGDRHFALDVDPRAGGFDSLIELEGDNGMLPPTVSQRTGSAARSELTGATIRGMHFVLSVPEDWGEVGCGHLRTARGSIVAGIDVKGAGGYIMAAPSVHPNGTTYELMLPLSQGVAAAPCWLLTMLPCRGKGTTEASLATTAEGPFFEVDDVTALKLFAWSWERHAPNRRETLMALTYRLFHALAPIDQAREILSKAARALDDLSSHNEPYDPAQYVEAKLRQTYGRASERRPEEWRVRQLLNKEGITCQN